MRNELSHFTLNGTPLCDCQYPANYERLRAAGSPPCCDLTAKQLARFVALAAQFPGRVALVNGNCPNAGSAE